MSTLLHSNDLELGDLVANLGEKKVNYSDLRQVTVNMDTNRNDRVGGTVVMQWSPRGKRGAYSALPSVCTTSIDFADDARAKIAELIGILEEREVPVETVEVLNRLFKRVYLSEALESQ